MRVRRVADEATLSHLADLAGWLEKAGQADAAATVREGIEAARKDPAQAAAVIRQVAALVAGRAPAYGQGSAELARSLRLGAHGR